VVLQFGHNDNHAPDKPESTDADTEYKDNLRRYVDESREAGAQIILVTPMHRRTFRAGTMTKELQPYADAMKSVAAEKGIPCIDLYSASGRMMEALGEEKSAFLSVKPEDRTHFSPEGADAMARLIVHELKTATPLAPYLKEAAPTATR
jgi:lysophospholipase L1-like esterase